MSLATILIVGALGLTCESEPKRFLDRIGVSLVAGSSLSDECIVPGAASACVTVPASGREAYLRTYRAQLMQSGWAIRPRSEMLFRRAKGENCTSILAVSPFKQTGGTTEETVELRFVEIGCSSPDLPGSLY